MHEILKLRLQGFSAYKIARKLNQDPPMVYKSLKAAKRNFAEIDKMLLELKALGWPEKLAQIENENRVQQKRTFVRPRASETSSRPEEIPIKFI